MSELDEGVKEVKWSQELKDLAGAWKDLPTAEEIRKISGQDKLKE